MIASSAISDRGCFAARHTVAEVPWLPRTLLAKSVKFSPHGLDRATNRPLRFTSSAVRFTSSAVLRPHPRGRARRGVSSRNNYIDPLSCMPSRRALLWLAGAAWLCSASAHGIARQVQACHKKHWFWSASSSRQKCIDCVLQDLSPTAEISLSFELSDATATQTSGNLPTRSPVNMTLYFPTNGDQAYLLQPSLHTPTNISEHLLLSKPVTSTAKLPGGLMSCQFNSGVNPDLPWVMMMNGANCYSQDYTFLLSQLAGRGYLAVVPTQLHPKPPKFRGKDLMKGIQSKSYSMVCVYVLPSQAC